MLVCFKIVIYREMSVVVCGEGYFNYFNGVIYRINDFFWVVDGEKL